MYAGGSRWFDGTNETMADPTEDVDSYGSLTGITAIFHPQPYRGELSEGDPRTASTRLKTVALRPIPTARMRIADTVNNGDRRKRRAA